MFSRKYYVSNRYFEMEDEAENIEHTAGVLMYGEETSVFDNAVIRSK